jgi:hypothetical protein
VASSQPVGEPRRVARRRQAEGDETPKQVGFRDAHRGVLGLRLLGFAVAGRERVDAVAIRAGEEAHAAVHRQ